MSRARGLRVEWRPKSPPDPCPETRSQYPALLDIEVRAGLHTGESDLREGGSPSRSGGAGEVPVSHTARDLVAGSRITFEERGAHASEGPPGDRRLFRVGRGARV